MEKVTGADGSALGAVSSPISTSAVAPRGRTAPYPLSPGQRRLWFMEQLSPGLSIHNEAEAVRLFGELDLEAIQNALNLIVGRHEVLRTTIHLMDNEPMAVVHDTWPIHLKQIDVSAMPSSERQAEVSRLLLEVPSLLFHLEREPGIRVTVLSLGAREHVFILTMHHIVSDWVSIGIFWRELAALYRSFFLGEMATLPPLAIQYGDYAVSRAKQTEATFARQLSFWEQNLQRAPRLLELPADRTRPPMPSFRGARRRLFLTPTLTEALRNLSQQTATTLFGVFAAALNTLLHRYTGNEDILVGIPVPDRDTKELQSVIGFLLHTHVLRTELSGDMTFRDLLVRIQNRILKLHIHRAVPFDHIVRRLQPERSLSYSPLFQVMLNWRSRDQLPSFIGLEKLKARPDFAENGASKFDFTLYVTDCGDELWLEMEYSTDLFDEDRIVRMLGHYQTLLEAVACDPDRCLMELPLLPTAERQSVLEDWNQTTITYPKGRLLCELIENQVERSPDALAVIFENEHLTFRELSDRANAVAQILQKLGVGPNVLVGICVERSLEMLVGLLAILKAGGAYVPLDPAYPSDRLTFMLEDCQPLVLLTQTKLRTRLPTHGSQLVFLDIPLAELPAGVDRVLNRCGRDPGDLAYLIYTSGSTGRPKGVRVSNQALVNFLCAMQREPGMDSEDTLLAVTTLSFDIAGLELFLPLISGARIVIASREAAADGVQLSTLMSHHRITMMQATPATWRLLLDAGWKGSPELTILCGGEAWPPALADRLLPRCKALWNMYGPTETTIWSSVTRVESGKAVLIGFPIANTTFYILDRHQMPVPVGVPGELYIGGASLAQGYHNRAELTKQRFVNDPFSDDPRARLYRTGDLVRRILDGKIEFLGRMDNQTKIRGFRIELGEIETCLKHHPHIDQCIVVALEKTDGDKRLAAYMVLSGTRSDFSASELRNFLKQKLPEYMVPATYVRLESLPLTPNGKIDRNALPVPDQLVARDPREKIVSPRNQIELGLVKIWEKLLDLKVESVRDNFFDLGGHSLLAVRLFAEIEKDFKVRLPIAALFEAPTIEDLGHILNSEVVFPRWCPLVPIQRSGRRPPFFCFHGAGGTVLIYRKLSQYLGSNQPFYGLQAQGLDGRSRLLTTIEEMAALYVTEIRRIQPHGPYFLGGYCMGGSIAYEAAQQFKDAGEDVALLALFDTANWHEVRFGSWNKISDIIQRLIFHAAALFEVDAKGKHNFLAEKVQELRNRIPVWRGQMLTQFATERSLTKPSMLPAHIWRTNHQGVAQLCPQTLSWCDHRFSAD